MLKMFTTQISGLLKRIQDGNEEAFEDGARLLAQAMIGEGKIFIFAEKEMEGVLFEATQSMEPLASCYRWDGLDREAVTMRDRVIIFSRFADDEQPLNAATMLYEEKIPFITVSTRQKDTPQLADVHIDLQLKKGLLPREDGERFVFPASLAALYVYHGLKIKMEEILEDY